VIVHSHACPRVPRPAGRNLLGAVDSWAAARALHLVASHNATKESAMKTLSSISLDQLAAVTGGANAKAPATTTLHKRKIGNTTLIGNQTADDMFWESKPF
jgi:hypothetical protein